MPDPDGMMPCPTGDCDSFFAGMVQVARQFNQNLTDRAERFVDNPIKSINKGLADTGGFLVDVTNISGIMGEENQLYNQIEETANKIANFSDLSNKEKGALFMGGVVVTAEIAISKKTKTSSTRNVVSESPTPKGGAYGKLNGESKTGFQKHHVPADAASSLSRYKGGAVQVLPEDHKLTASYGSSKAAKAYRAKQQAFMDAGDFNSALQMDIKDLRSKFGDKYDSAIKEVQQYYEDLDMFN